MLERIKCWYNDTPQQVRYFWAYTVGCAVGIPRFCWMLWSGSEFGAAMMSGLMLYTIITAIVLAIPMTIADLRDPSVWKFRLRPKADEMEKQINVRARAITSIVLYTYIAASVLGILVVADAKGMEMIPVSVLEHLIHGAIYVSLMSVAISTVVIYSRREAGGESRIESSDEQEPDHA